MRFLFRLDLSLHAGAGKKIGILNYTTKQGLKLDGLGMYYWQLVVQENSIQSNLI